MAGLDRNRRGESWKRVARSRASLGLLLGMLAGGCMVLGPLAPMAQAQIRMEFPPVQPKPNFTIYWGVDTHGAERVAGRDWEAQMNFGDTPLHQNVWIVYEQYMLDDVRDGPDGLAATLAPGWRAQLREKLRRHFDEWLVPDPNAAGIGCLDVEFLHFIHDRVHRPGTAPNTHGYHLENKWFSYLHTYRQDLISGKSPDEVWQIFEQTYNQAIRNMIVACLEEARSLRPNIKWGMYGWPNAYNFEYDLVAPVWQREQNDRVAWLWEASDIIMPVLYSRWESVPNDQTPPNSHSQRWYRTERYFGNNIREAQRIANGKPIIALVNVMHFDQPIVGQILGDMDIEAAVRLPYELGIDGIYVWGVMEHRQRFEDYQRVLTQRFLPAVRSMLPPSVRPPSPSTTSTSSSGSSGQNTPPSQPDTPPSQPPTQPPAPPPEQAPPSQESAGAQPPTGQNAPGPDTAPPPPPPAASSAPPSPAMTPSGQRRGARDRERSNAASRSGVASTVRVVPRGTTSTRSDGAQAPSGSGRPTASTGASRPSASPARPSTRPSRGDGTVRRGTRGIADRVARPPQSTGSTSGQNSGSSGSSGPNP